MPVIRFLIEFFIECLFYHACGWLGYMVVKTITLGKVDLDWNEGAESIVAGIVGLAVVLFIGFGIILVL